MKSLEDYIQDKNNYHLRNLYIEIDEELRELQDNPHSNKRKYQQVRKYLTKNITKDELKELINKCDNQITNACLNNELSINDEFGIIKIENDNQSLSMICILKYFDKETLDYDIMIKTNNRVDYIYKFKDIKFYLEIEKNGSIKKVYI